MEALDEAARDGDGGLVWLHQNGPDNDSYLHGASVRDRCKTILGRGSPSHVRCLPDVSLRRFGAAGAACMPNARTWHVGSSQRGRPDGGPASPSILKSGRGRT